MPADSAKGRRVFFALWPDSGTSSELYLLGRRAQSLGGGRQMRRDSLHMTLAFIGEVSVERLDALQQAAAGVSVSEFSLCLDCLACWRHNHIVWAGCEQTPLQLLSLVGQIVEQLEVAGMSLDVRDFAAHVTLLRDAQGEALPGFEPINWQVSEFVLAASKGTAGDGGYDIVGRWPLISAA